MFVVTGGAGFIGSVVVAELNSQFPDVPVVVCDWLEEGDKWKNINKRVLHDVVFPEDLSNYLETYAEDIHAVIHMGAISATTERDGNKLTRQNINYTLDLFDFCQSADIPFIYASSAATYGAGAHGFVDDNSLSALTKLVPLNGYGFTKHLCDKAIITRDTKTSQWVGLKFFNVYGPNELEKGRMMSLVPQTVKQIQETGAMKLFKSHKEGYADGEQLRDFVYVKDIARAIVWFIKNPEVSGIFNMGTGKARSFKDLVTATFNAMGKTPNINYIPMPEDLRDQYQYFTEADMTRFNAVTKGQFTFTSLEDGVADYVQNHLLAEDPYL